MLPFSGLGFQEQGAPFRIGLFRGEKLDKSALNDGSVHADKRPDCFAIRPKCNGDHRPHLPGAGKQATGLAEIERERLERLCLIFGTGKQENNAVCRNADCISVVILDPHAAQMEPRAFRIYGERREGEGASRSELGHVRTFGFWRTGDRLRLPDDVGDRRRWLCSARWFGKLRRSPNPF